MKWRPFKSYLGKPLNLPTGKAWYEEDILNAERYFIKQFDKSYSASQNEELRKENEELKSRFEKSFNLAEIRRKEIDKLIIEQGQLQSTIDEKNKEIAELQKKYNNCDADLFDATFEIERLKGLIEQLMSGDKLKIVRNSEGNYTAIFNPENL